MTRLASALIALALCFAALPAGAEPRLRAAVTVTGPLVTLGDLFTGVGGAADTAVFQSPDPGTTGIVSASRVLAAAATHGLQLAGADTAEIRVTRASRFVELGEMKHVVSEAVLATNAAEGDVEIDLDHMARDIHIEADALAPLTVERLDYDAATGRFAAVVSIADSRIMGQGMRISGRAMQIVELPVLLRPIKRGETIGPTDVGLERLPLARAPEGAVRSLEEIVGKSARSNLRPGAPVSEDRLMRPILVGRNDSVTIIYRASGLLLTVRGRSLGEGGRGDLITVMNSQSNRTIEAVVAGPGQVVVEPPREIAVSVASN